METLSIILNFILASGLAGTILFFNAKKRKENAAADTTLWISYIRKIPCCK